MSRRRSTGWVVRAPRWRVLSTALVLAALVLAGGSRSLASTAVPPGSTAQVKALVAASVKISKLTATLAAELPGARNDNAEAIYKMPNQCMTQTQCVFGAVAGTRAIVLYGDSHARMWLPALTPLATAAGDRLVVVGRDGCPVVALPIYNAIGGAAACTTLRRNAISIIDKIAPIAVVVSESTTVYLKGPRKRYTSTQWESGLEAALHVLPASAKVIVIGDVQQLNEDPSTCLAAYPRAIQSKCAINNPNKFKPGYMSAERAAAKTTGAAYVDPTPWLCTTRRCSPVIGTFIAYWNSWHVSASYATYLSTVMTSAVKPSI